MPDIAVKEEDKSQWLFVSKLPTERRKKMREKNTHITTMFVEH